MQSELPLLAEDIPKSDFSLDEVDRFFVYARAQKLQPTSQYEVRRYRLSKGGMAILYCKADRHIRRWVIRKGNQDLYDVVAKFYTKWKRLDDDEVIDVRDELPPHDINRGISNGLPKEMPSHPSGKRLKRTTSESRAEKRQLLEKQDGECYFCFVPLYVPSVGRDDHPTLNGRLPATMEHLLAISKGGSEAIENKVVCCAGCNQKVDTWPIADKIALRDANRQKRQNEPGSSGDR